MSLPPSPLTERFPQTLRCHVVPDGEVHSGHDVFLGLIGEWEDRVHSVSEGGTLQGEVGLESDHQLASLLCRPVHVLFGLHHFSGFMFHQADGLHVLKEILDRPT